MIPSSFITLTQPLLYQSPPPNLRQFSLELQQKKRYYKMLPLNVSQKHLLPNDKSSLKKQARSRKENKLVSWIEIKSILKDLLFTRKRKALRIIMSLEKASISQKKKLLLRQTQLGGEREKERSERFFEESLHVKGFVHWMAQLKWQ
jgi:hypothetical protein